MLSIQLAWDSLKGLRKLAVALTAFSSLVLAQEQGGAQDSLSLIDSLSLFENTTVAVPVTEGSLSSPSLDSAVVFLDTSALAAGAQNQKDSLKSVLYLGGGDHSPWFHLGVLYAIEEYGVPVDSVVGTSWGAWIGALWSKGVSPDEIQKIMLDSYIAPFVGHDLSAAENKLAETTVDPHEIPISLDGAPSVRQRFTFAVDSSGGLKRNKRSLSPDSNALVRSLAKLRFQEALYRQPVAYRRPFSVLSCDGSTVGNSVADVIGSIPLWESSGRISGDNSHVSGEVCPYFAYPAEDNPLELPIIVVADPLRSVPVGDARTRTLKQQAAVNLQNQPGVIVRAHTILDTSRSMWIQSGFSALEQRLSDLSPLMGRRMAYHRDGAVAKPWFRFNPAYDSLSSEVLNSVKTCWDESDTGMLGPEYFAKRLQEQPAFDSLSFDMLPNGNLQVDAAVHPVFDVAVGGFGSSAIGPNAYFEASVFYVDQMEIQLVLAGFYGVSSYGVQPRLNVSKLWNRHWGLRFGYDYLNLTPLKSFNNEVPRSLRVYNEERSDLRLALLYQVDASQTVSAEFMFGHRTFELDPIWFGKRKINTYPVAPTLHYAYLQGRDDSWFAENGIAFNAYAGMESIGFDFGVNDVIPIYWKLMADARYTVSPRRFATFTVAAAAGMERFHDEGYGYVYPKSFEYRPLDVVYRLHAKVTPWSTEWYNAELSSHEYALVRASGSLHGKYLGVWLFGAYYHDFEDSPFAVLEQDKIILEPAVRFAYRSLNIYAGMNRIVDTETIKDLTHFGDYSYFIKIGNYEF